MRWRVTPKSLLRSGSGSSSITPVFSGKTLNKGLLSTCTNSYREASNPSISLRDLSRKLQGPLSRRAASEIANQVELDSTSCKAPFKSCQVQALASAFGRSLFPEGTLRVLTSSHRSGTKLKASAYENIARNLAFARAWSQIPPLVSLALRQLLRVNRRLLNWRIRSLIELKEFGRLEFALEDFQRRNIRPNPETYHLLMQGHVMNNNLPKAQDSIDWMVEAGFPVSSATQAALISVFSKTIGPSTEIENLAVGALQDADTTTETTLLNGLVRSRIAASDVEGAYRYLLKFDISLEDLDHPLLRQDLHSDGAFTRAAPNTETFRMALALFLSHRDMHRYDLVFRTLLSRSLQMDTGLAALVIRAAAMNGKMDDAVAVLAFLCHRNPQAVSLVSRMIPRPVEPPDWLAKKLQALNADTHVFNALLKVWLPRQGLRKVGFLLRAMNITVGGPNHQTLGILIRHISRYRGVQPTHIIRFLCIASHFWPIPFDNCIYEAILSSAIRLEISRRKGGYSPCSGRQLVDLSALMLKGVISSKTSFPLSLESLKLPPTEQQYLTLLMQSLCERRIRLSSAGLALQLRHQAVIQSDVRGAENTLTEMKSRGMNIGAIHYAALIEGYILAGELEAAELVAQRYGHRPGAVVLHTIIVQGYARSCQPHKAQSTFDEMLRRGIRPDWAAIDAVVGAWNRSGLSGMAKSTLLRLWPFLSDTKPSVTKETSLSTLLRDFRTLRYMNEPHISRLIMTKARFGTSTRRRFNATLFRSSLPGAHLDAPEG